MTIGLDFDNTIVSYDELFHRVAVESGRVPADLPASKEAVRDFLRNAGLEDVWTEMQGTVYGRRMAEARAFPGALETIASLKAAGHRVLIISHKTRYPFLGERWDLHAAARAWLDAQGFFDPERLGFGASDVFFEPTKEEKLARIARESCTHFVDDLPEILAHPLFPSGVDRLLFAPRPASGASGFPHAASWPEIFAWLTR
jgi:hypothetical protein